MEVDKRLKVADFAALVGCAQKTVYRMINNNRLMTVNDIVNGRKTTFIITTDIEIEKIKKELGLMSDNDCQYEETLSVNDMSKPQTPDYIEKIFDKLIQINEQSQERLMTVNDELMTYKSRIPLLEDKASREGLYLQEIKDLQLSKKKVIVWLITVIILFAVSAVILGFLLVIEHSKPPKVITTEKVVEKIVEKPVYRYIKK